MAFIRDKYPTLPREYTKAKFPPDPEPVPGSRAKQPRRSTANPELAAAGTTGNSLATKPYTQQDEGEKWNTLVKALRVNRQRLLRMRGVTAVDLGYKIVDGITDFTGQDLLHGDRDRLVATAFFAAIAAGFGFGRAPGGRRVVIASTGGGEQGDGHRHGGDTHRPSRSG